MVRLVRDRDRSTGGRGRPSVRAAAPVLLGLAVTVAGLGPAAQAATPASSAPASSAVPTAAAALPPAAAEAARQVAAAPVPVLTWKPCAGAPDRQCTRAQVPLDYDAPTGARISLALAKLPAGDPARRIGTLFVNPGGPGGSGVDMVKFFADQLFTPAVRARFDIVGFDPRGVAASTTLQCFDTTDQALAALAPFAFPYTRAEERTWFAADRRYAQGCTRRAGAVLNHMSTADVARDIDLLRRAVGEARTTFVGYSYGSYIGSTYASLFPNRVRAVVIDGVIDPVSYATGRGDEALTLPIDARLVSEQGAYQTLQGFLSLCDQNPTRCAFSGGDPRRRYASLANRLIAAPAQLPDGNGGTAPFGYADLVSTTLGAMYGPESWPSLAEFLQQLDLARGPAAAAALTRLRTALAPQRGARAYQQVLEGFAGVWCTDGANPSSPQAWATSARAADAKNPYFGRPWIFGSSICAVWPGSSADRYAGPFTVPGANGVLVVGNINDPATRYEDAVSTAGMLPGSRLLTVNGWGHTSIQLSRCADAYTARYLINGVLPPRGAVCQVDRIPFSAPTPAPAQAARTWVLAQNLPVLAAGRPPR